MTTTETASTNLTLGGKKLVWARAGLLALAVLTPFFLAAYIRDEWRIYYDAYSSGQQISALFFGSFALISWVTIFLAWVLALILLRKKPNDVGFILVILLLLSRAYSSSFWILLFFGPTPPIDIEPGWQAYLSSIMSIPFDLISALSLIAVLLTFPTGRFHSRPARWLFWFTLVTLTLYLTNLFIGVWFWQNINDLLEYILFIFLPVVNMLNNNSLYPYIQVLAGLLLFLRYRAMPNSEQRQQIKWIVVFFVLGSCAVAVNLILQSILGIPFIQHSTFIQENPDLTYGIVLTLTELPATLINLAIVIAFGIAIFSYRLWDVDIFINRALVYASLTAVLGGLTIISITLVDYIVKQWIGDESSIWGVLVSLLPAAGAFNPLRERLQAWVDQRFKPEEVDFSATFIEFNPPVRERLALETILQTVSRQVAKQLELDHARIYLEQPDGQLSPALPDTPGAPPLDENQLSTLRAGELVVPESGGEYSLLVPLLVPRARFPDFLGVIVLGQRLNGKGYSTPILENLKNLGSEAGIAIYLSTITAQKANDAAQAG